MNTPFKGEIAWMPDFIGEELMKQQEKQGNKRDITIFEKTISNGKENRGFDWSETKGGHHFWYKVLIDKNINLFLTWFKPELDVWDDKDNKHVAVVIGYDENASYPFKVEAKIRQNANSCYYAHAQLPKKNTTEKENLLKKADELLTKAAELKEAAEKL